MRKSKVPSTKMTEGSSVRGEVSVSKMISHYMSVNHIPLQLNSLSSCVVINWLTWFLFYVQLKNKQVLCVETY